MSPANPLDRLSAARSKYKDYSYSRFREATVPQDCIKLPGRNFEQPRLQAVDARTPEMFRVSITGGVRVDRRKDVCPWLVDSSQ